MPDPVDSLEGKVEYAILAELSDQGIEDYANLFCGHEFEEKEGDQVHVFCSGGAEIAFNCGTYLQRVRVGIRSPADREANETQVADPREVHRAIVQRVRNALLASGIESRLSGHETEFTCDLFYPVDSDSSVDGRFLVTSLEWECSCRRADTV